MIVFGIGTSCDSHVRRSERGDPQGFPLLSFYCSSRWQEDVSQSTSLVLLKWDKETSWRFHSTMSYVLAGKG